MARAATFVETMQNVAACKANVPALFGVPWCFGIGSQLREDVQGLVSRSHIEQNALQVLQPGVPSVPAPIWHVWSPDHDDDNGDMTCLAYRHCRCLTNTGVS